MKKFRIFLKILPLCLCILLFSGGMAPVKALSSPAPEQTIEEARPQPKKFIKWVDFKVPYSVLKTAYDLNLKANKEELDFPLIKSLAYVTSKNGNSFSINRDNKTLYNLYTEVKNGTSIDEFGSKNKYYNHYKEVYTAVFAQFMGDDGLKVYHPVAKGHWWNASDDFGNSRTYGFKRRHLGHDIWGSVGAPIMAIEGGTVTEIGWNRYGGWRIGIRSHDQKRYYYYAHLRKGKPFAQDFQKGDTIEAGQHIGYLGVTGYSTKKDVNMGTKPHLHLGLQLIFDESQLDGNGEIWIDLYAITKLLSLNRIALPPKTNVIQE